jgi:hypothetical protein
MDSQPDAPADAQTPKSQGGDASQMHLDVHLARYSSFRAEILGRISFQSQAFNYLVVVLGAAVAAGAALLQAERPDLVQLLILFIPIVTAPLSYIYFDNELMIMGIGGNIFTDLSNHVSSAVKHEVQLGARALLYLEDSTRCAHRWLSYGRWLAFIMPSLGPTIYAFVLAPRYAHDARYWLLVVGDCLVTALLLAAVIAVYREQEKPGGFRSWGEPERESTRSADSNRRGFCGKRRSRMALGSLLQTGRGSAQSRSKSRT